MRPVILLASRFRQKDPTARHRGRPGENKRPAVTSRSPKLWTIGRRQNLAAKGGRVGGITEEAQRLGTNGSAWHAGDTGLTRGQNPTKSEGTTRAPVQDELTRRTRCRRRDAGNRAELTRLMWDRWVFLGRREEHRNTGEQEEDGDKRVKLQNKTNHVFLTPPVSLTSSQPWSFSGHIMYTHKCEAETHVAAASLPGFWYLCRLLIQTKTSGDKKPQ